MKKKNPEKKKIFDFEKTEELEKIVHVSSNLMKKKDKNENEYLLFDGKSLQWIKNKKTIASWKAMSRHKSFQSKKHTGDVNRGPIPEGEWDLKKEDYQNYDDENNALEDHINRKTLFYGNLKGSWPGGGISLGKSSYLDYSKKRKETDTKGRTGISLHGGTVFGSHGCIDLQKGLKLFIRRYKRYGKDIKLKVKYRYGF